MSVLVRVGVDICIQLSTVSSCLAGQVNNNNNTLSNEPEEKRGYIAGRARLYSLKSAVIWRKSAVIFVQ